MKTTPKKKLSAYNRHVQREMKAGKTMKQAAASWRSKKTGASKKRRSPKKNTKRRKTNVGKKKTKKKGGFRLPGGLGPKGILTGVLGLAFIPRFIPVATPGAAKLGTGLVLRALNLGGGGALASVGIMELVAGQILPMLSGFGVGGGNGAASTGFDY